VSAEAGAGAGGTIDRQSICHSDSAISGSIYDTYIVRSRYGALVTEHTGFAKDYPELSGKLAVDYDDGGGTFEIMIDPEDAEEDTYKPIKETAFPQACKRMSRAMVPTLHMHLHANNCIANMHC
jgi:hypothetical protein